MKTLIVSFLFGLSTLLTTADFQQKNAAQAPHSDPGTAYCATDWLRNRQFEENPAQLKQWQVWESDWHNHQGGDMDNPPPYELPVVVHIIHQYGPENISDAQAEQAIADINEAFSNQGYYDPSTGVNTEIQFCLAKRDPDGGPTTGITRTPSVLTEMILETQDLDLKDLIRWEPTEYINIWLVKEINSLSVGSGVAGYAYFPSSHGQPEDGIVIEADLFGSSQANSAIAVHELGHYLGLYHTFEGGCTNDDCLADGDRVCDTPPDATTVGVPCGIDVNSCSTDVNPADPNNPFTSDQNDLYIDYMDYGDPDCYSAFTAGQADRMAFFIETARASLLDSEACTHPCPNPIAINFVPADTIIEVGTQIDFENLTVGATDFVWLVDGSPLSSGTDFSFLFNTEGAFVVTLQASNGNPDCDVERSILVRVIECFGNAYVSDVDGQDVGGCGSPDNPCQTIQYALDNVICPGDTVFIYSGTYSLPVGTPALTPIAEIPEGYSVTFLGLLDNGPVVIDMQNERRGFQYDYTGSGCPDSNPDDGIPADNVIRFENLTFQNAFVEAYSCGNTNIARGGAIQIYNNLESSLEVEVKRCDFRDNFLDDPVFLNNNGRSVSGAAIFVNGRVANNTAGNTSAIVRVDSCTFTNNRCQQLDNGGHGGAICIVNCNSTAVENSQFCNNEVFGVNADNGDLQFDRNAGGAVLFWDNYSQTPGHEYLVNNCLFVGNSALTEDGETFSFQSEGGALFMTRGDNLNAVTSATLTIGNSQFFDNIIETGIEHFDLNSGTLDTTSIGNNIQGGSFELDLLPPDTLVCDSVFISVQDTLFGVDYEWNTGAVGPSVLVTEAGTYTVTLQLGDCSVTDSIEVEVQICQELCDNGIDDDGDGLIDCCDPDLWDAPCCEDQPILNLGPDTLYICDNGTLTLEADSGFVSYIWQDGWTEQSYTVFGPGRYWVTVEDSICGTATDTVDVLEDVETILQVSPGNPLICPGESIQLTTSPVFDTYQWVPSDHLSCDDCPNPVATPPDPISYIVIGSFSNGCYSVDTVDVNFQTITTSETVTVCAGESAVIFGEPQTTPGDYTQTFTSVAGCDSIHTISLNNFAPIELGAATVVPACPGASEGGIALNVSGAGPFAFEWDGLPGESGAEVQGLPAGTYTVTITDANDCSREETIVIPELEAPGYDPQILPELCPDECNGQITFNPTGGTPPYSYSLDGGADFTEGVLTDLCPDNYSLEITDANGCSSVQSFAIEPGLPAEITVSSPLEIIRGDTVQVNVEFSGTPISVLWDPGEGLSCTDCLEPLVFATENSTYSVVAIDENGCFATAELDVVILVTCDVATIEIPNIFTPDGDGNNDVFRPLVGEEGVALERMQVFNRWGQLVFESTAPDAEWDGLFNGEPVQQDVYVYTMEFACPADRKTVVGELTLIR
jgi:gliding motility-associated-like protein